jgi:hypothetical protein
MQILDKSIFAEATKYGATPVDRASSMHAKEEL